VCADNIREEELRHYAHYILFLVTEKNILRLGK